MTQKDFEANFLQGLNSEQQKRAKERIDYFKAMGVAVPYGIIYEAAINNLLKPMEFRKNKKVITITIR